MSSRGNSQPPGALSFSCLKWLFVLAIPFSALFMEARINTGILKRDLRLSVVNDESRRLREANDAYKVQIATLEKLERIETAAPELGLIAPQPNQVKTIYRGTGEAPYSPPFAIADAAGADAGGGAASEDSSCTTTHQLPTRTAATAGLRASIAAGLESYFGPSLSHLPE